MAIIEASDDLVGSQPTVEENAKDHAIVLLLLDLLFLTVCYLVTIPSRGGG
jgi:hypothetical protein